MKQISLTLEGLDGNTYSLMGEFQEQARKEGWTDEEIDAVLKKCMSGDYKNLVRTLDELCVPVL